MPIASKENIHGYTKGSATADDETIAGIYQGLNTTQLSRLFNLAPTTVIRRLFENGIKPVGRKGRADLFSVREVAPYLTKPVFDIETAIKKMSFHDLPKDLSKEFWAGQKTKQDFEERAGHLWRTEKVIEEVGELMKVVKMSTLLMLDGVERQTELSERQREIIKSLTHGMLDDLVKRIEDKFKPAEESHGQRQEAEDEEAL